MSRLDYFTLRLCLKVPDVAPRAARAASGKIRPIGAVDLHQPPERSLTAARTRSYALRCRHGATMLRGLSTSEGVAIVSDPKVIAFETRLNPHHGSFRTVTVPPANKSYSFSLLHWIGMSPCPIIPLLRRTVIILRATIDCDHPLRWIATTCYD